MRYRNEERRTEQRGGDRRYGQRFQAEGKPPFESWEDDDGDGRDAGSERYANDPEAARRYGERDYGQADWERGQHPYGYGPARPGGDQQSSGWGRGGDQSQPGYADRGRFGRERQEQRSAPFRDPWRAGGDYGGRYGQGRYGQGQYGQGQYGEGQYGGEFSGGTPRDDNYGYGDGGRGQRGARYGSSGSQQSFRGRGPQSYTRSDERIREEVCDLLTDDETLDATSIDVQVANGEITLSGTVRDREGKRCAEDLAESVSGVRNVQNQLRVQTGADSASGSGSAERTTGGAAVTRGGEQRAR
jgi:hypothetical protein